MLSRICLLALFYGYAAGYLQVKRDVVTLNIETIPKTQKVESGCNLTVNLNYTKTLINLQNETKHSTICTWKLNSPKNTTILIKMTDVGLNGNLDRVIALDGLLKNSSVIQQCGKDCRKYTDSVMLSSENSMQVLIELDSTASLRLFSIEAWSQENGGLFYDTGRIGLIQNSTSNETYYQLHSTNTDKQIQIMLDDALLYPTTSIEVYDRTPGNDQLLAVFKSATDFVPITSSQQDLLIVTKDMTGPLYFGGNFTTVQPGCHKVSPKSAGDFTLDRKNFNTKCNWLINPINLLGNIMLNIRSVDLCENETLVMYEGLSQYGLRLATITKETQGLYPMFTAKARNGLSVVLNRPTNESCQSSVPFSGSYWVVPGCSAMNISSPGTITSPRYPDQYPLNSLCTWSTMAVNKPTSLYITINSLDLAKGHNISIRSNSTMATFKGSNLPSDLVTKVANDSMASIKFDSGTINLGKGLERPGQGFNLSYKILDCGESLNVGKGNIHSAKDIPANAKECIWVVTVPPKSGKTTVNIVSVKVNFTGVGNWQNLELRDGGSVRSPLLNKDISMVKSKSFLTRYNTLWIQYRKNTTSDITADKTFSFSLSYSTYSCNTKHQCKNGICLHPDWICNNVDDCGDNTDEIGCGSKAPETKGVKVWLAAVIGVLCFLIGVVMTIVIPALYKRWKYPNYSQLKDMMDPAIS